MVAVLFTKTILAQAIFMLFFQLASDKILVFGQDNMLVNV
jgi:hypothetical protein